MYKKFTELNKQPIENVSVALVYWQGVLSELNKL